MTIILVGLISDGLILAADSRQIRMYKPGLFRIDSDTAQKIIPITSSIAAIVSGQGYFYQSENESPKSVYSLVRSITKSISDEVTVKHVAELIHAELTQVINHQSTFVHNQNSNLTVFIGGYNPNNDVGELFRCVIPGEVTLERKTNDAGIVWNGQDDMINRLILGYDPRMVDLFDLSDKSIKTFSKQKNRLQLNINFQTMTIYDAISLVESLISTTIILQNLSSGLVGLPDIIPVCGGGIEMAIITPYDGFSWIKHKNICDLIST